MEKGVSFRRPEIIERKANAILQKAKEKGFYNFDSATPIDLIVEKIFRLRMNFVDLNKSFQGALGALDLKNKRIWIDESLNHTISDNSDFTTEARCNYTIAHEGGHYVFHRPQYRKAENLALFHDSSDPRTKALETQANMFASYILMPKVLMIKKWGEIDHNNFAADQVIGEMMRFFRVSRETMVYKLKFLGLLDPSY